MIAIRTQRLELIPSALVHLDAELESPDRLAEILGVRVPEGWPPGEYDRAAIEFLRGRLAENEDAIGWYGWYAILRAASGPEERVLIGAGGYFGPPGADGMVEVGYSIVPDFRRRGYATELLRGLIDRAFGEPGVSGVLAHTHPDNIASIRVLEHCGFAFDGPGEGEGTIRFVLLRLSG